MDKPGRSWLRQIENAALHDDSPARIIGVRPDGALRLLIDGALNGERRSRQLIEDRAANRAISSDCQLHQNVVVRHAIARYYKYAERQPFHLSSLLDRPIRHPIGNQKGAPKKVGRRLKPYAIYKYDAVIAVNVFARTVVPVARSSPVVDYPGA